MMWIGLLAGLLLGVSVVAVVYHVALKNADRTIAALYLEVKDARSLERLATERLIQARKDGFEVPVTPDSATPPAEESDELPPLLTDLIRDWESPTAQAAQRKVILRLRADGLNDVQIHQKLMPTPASE